MKSKLIKTDGTVVPIEPRNGTDFTWDELFCYVGGFIEIVRIGGGYMVVDDAGKLKCKPVNDVATLICLRHGFLDTIVGDAVYCDTDKIK